MQTNDIQALASRLKENKDMQVETTTLGKFLGDSADKVASYLGREVLLRPVIVSVKSDEVQILDLGSGFVAVISKGDDAMAKIIETFSREKQERPKIAPMVESTQALYKQVITQEPGGEKTTARQLWEFKQVMYKGGSNDERSALVEKTIRVLESHKTSCQEHELPRVHKAQQKLTRLKTYIDTKKLAPGQIPSVYEIAIWDWVN
jgi:hypothetical protein